MDKDVLARWLAEGKSLEEIGRLVGKGSSTVAYWVRKHGLRAAHVDRHAPRGAIARPVLDALVERGLSERSIAAELQVSQATVRHWLRAHDLATHRTVRRRALQAARDGGDPEPMLVCPHHGSARHVRERGRLRCAACRAEAVTARRRRVKEILVGEAGGRCVICGYDAFVGARCTSTTSIPARRSSTSPIAVPREASTARERRPRSACCCVRTATRRSKAVSESCRS
jgi:transposase